MDPESPGSRGAEGSARGSDAPTVSLRGTASTFELSDGRYELGELIASGGQGDVYRVYDRRLRRQLVMKVLDKNLAGDSISIARFIQEAQVTAQLQHPAIVPVHDIGALADGRPYYTMTEVRGRTLASVIADVHAASAAGWATEPGGFGFGRLIDVYHRVCEVIGYAHACGVIHRDLKPQNVMVGTFGETLVLDWGLARFVGDPAEVPQPLSSIRHDNDSFHSEIGSVVGTRGYMAPEQASGGGELGPASDVYALGMILREILTGERVALPVPVRCAPERPISDELVAIVQRAVAAAPSERYADANELAHAIAGFLDGDRKRERALGLLADARALLPRIAELRTLAAGAAREARLQLGPIPPHADAALKEPGWALEDRARELAGEADLETFRMTRLLDSSLIEADLPDAHALLAAHYHELHEAAERANDPAAARLELLLRTHDTGEHAAYLAGTGALTIATDPPHADIELRRYELRNRRLVDEHVCHLRAPLDAYELPRGSYLLVIRAAGHHEVRYPVAIGRHEHWLPIRPGDSHPQAIVLPRAGTIDDDEVYIPGGPFTCGGDPQAAGEVLARQRVWVDGFVMRRHPITNRELLAMVNALVDERDPRAEQIALAVVPRHRGTTAGEAGTLVWPRDADGRFRLGSDDEGVAWEPDTPAFMINWHGALAYATWLGGRTHRPYRLPGELEYEKAARGADARAFPWGNFFDPSWACMRLSREVGLRPATLAEFPVDESPYGVRGLAGNVVEWCADAYRREGPPLPDGRYTPPQGQTADDPVADRTLRGGCFLFDSFLLRAATRHNTSSIVRDVTLGFRLVRSLPGT